MIYTQIKTVRLNAVLFFVPSSLVSTVSLLNSGPAELFLKLSDDSGIIERAEGSMEEEMEQLRRSRSLEGGEFALSDALYFCKKGLESIVDDQVTQRFSSEELASWNLLTRTNQNFRYISLRLTIFWGIGVFVRYCVLFPLRSVCHSSTSHLPGEALISASLAFATGTAALTAVKQFSQRHVSVLSGHSSAYIFCF